MTKKTTKNTAPARPKFEANDLVAQQGEDGSGVLGYVDSVEEKTITVQPIALIAADGTLSRHTGHALLMPGQSSTAWTYVATV